jgi:hypothetical protein
MKQKKAQILENIGPCEDGSVDAVIFERVMHEYTNR